MRVCPGSPRFLSSFCGILSSGSFSAQLIRFLLRRRHISIDNIFRSSSIFSDQASAPKVKTVQVILRPNVSHFHNYWDGPILNRVVKVLTSANNNKLFGLVKSFVSSLRHVFTPLEQSLFLRSSEIQCI